MMMVMAIMITMLIVMKRLSVQRAAVSANSRTVLFGAGGWPGHHLRKPRCRHLLGDNDGLSVDSDIYTGRTS
jgi:hypothetical protein